MSMDIVNLRKELRGLGATLASLGATVAELERESEVSRNTLAKLIRDPNEIKKLVTLAKAHTGVERIRAKRAAAHAARSPNLRRASHAT